LDDSGIEAHACSVGEPERFPETALRVDDGTTPVIRCRVCATKGVGKKQAA
jgi:hypothetical protein